MLKLDQRKLGASQVVVPALGIGVWSWGDTRWWNYGQTHNQEDVTQAYRTCLEAGLNFFDTAEVYGEGASERLLGECHRQDGGQPILIATKFAPPQVPFSRAARRRSSARSLLQALDESLERLGVRQIDLYQIHTPSRVLKIEALMDAMAEAVSLGKIRAVGVSNYSAAMMRRAHARLAQHGIPLASNQVHYSLLHRYAETNGVLDACRELDVALIAYSPLEQGVLTGKYRHGGAEMAASLRTMLNIGLRLDMWGDTKGSISGLRRWLTRPRPMQPKKMEPLFEVLEEVAVAHRKSIAQVALNWLLTQDEHIIPIPGAKNARQATENAGAIGWRLTPEEHARLSQAEIATR